MKRWKYVRASWAQVGYTTLTSAADITFTNIDSSGYVYYTDENGDAVKVLYPSATPVVVDSDTSSITIYVDGSEISGTTLATGDTSQLTVYNENSLLVTDECSFGSSNSAVTVDSTGLCTAVSLTNATIITTTHEDGPTGSTTFIVA